MKKNNPWKEIELSDYENHMKLDSVKQLQAMNSMMKEQFDRYPIKSVMILGVAGGNGLEHIDTEKFRKVYGVDINSRYLKECEARYPDLADVLECLCIDLMDESIALPYADMVVANLLIEYIGYQCFQNAINRIRPAYVSCIIQINTDDSWVSDSPYLSVFDDLDRVHHQMEEKELADAMKCIGYSLTEQTEQSLPNGKKLVQLDFCFVDQY